MNPHVITWVGVLRHLRVRVVVIIVPCGNISKLRHQLHQLGEPEGFTHTGRGSQHIQSMDVERIKSTVQLASTTTRLCKRAHAHSLLVVDKHRLWRCKSRLALKYVGIGGLSSVRTCLSKEIGVLLFVCLNLTASALFMRLEVKTFQVLIYGQPKNSMLTEIDGVWLNHYWKWKSRFLLLLFVLKKGFCMF